MIRWDDKLYEFANDCVARSWQCRESGQTAESWGYTVPARLAYVCAAIVDLVVLPFALIATLFGALHALFTWDWNSPVFEETWNRVQIKSNHFFLSVCGSLISPAIAHKYRDANLLPYIVAIRIAITLGVVYYFANKKP